MAGGARSPEENMMKYGSLAAVMTVAATLVPSAVIAHGSERDELGRIVRMACEFPERPSYFDADILYAGKSVTPTGVDVHNYFQMREERIRFDAEGDIVLTVQVNDIPSPEEVFVCGKKKCMSDGKAYARSDVQREYPHPFVALDLAKQFNPVPKKAEVKR